MPFPRPVSKVWFAIDGLDQTQLMKFYGVVVKSAAFGERLLGLNPSFSTYSLFDLGQTISCLRFLICKMKVIIIIPASWGCHGLYMLLKRPGIQ